MKTLLVTVGSTQFNDLIEAVENDLIEFERVARDFLIDRIVIQHGRSRAPKLSKLENLFKVEISDYIQPEKMTELLSKSTVIISHGGAGTIFEVLRGNRENLEAFLVVENRELMDAHQSELLSSLADIGCPMQWIKNSKENNSIFNNILMRKKLFQEFKLPDPNLNALTLLINGYT